MVEMKELCLTHETLCLIFPPVKRENCSSDPEKTRPAWGLSWTWLQADFSSPAAPSCSLRHPLRPVTPRHVCLSDCSRQTDMTVASRSQRPVEWNRTWRVSTVPSHNRVTARQRDTRCQQSYWKATWGQSPLTAPPRRWKPQGLGANTLMSRHHEVDPERTRSRRNLDFMSPIISHPGRKMNQIISRQTIIQMEVRI